MSMRKRRCLNCGKLIYSAADVLDAALQTSLTYGTPMDKYPCPENPEHWHLRKGVSDE